MSSESVGYDDPNWAELDGLKYGVADNVGWGPRLRAFFGYHTPDDWYEAFVAGAVREDTTWLDIGCGRGLFQSNHALAAKLAARCRLLVGVDPDRNIDDNPYVHQRARCSIEDYTSEQQFSLITMRMVAEHIGHPERVISSLRQLSLEGGLIVIYTVWKWAPVSLIAAATPLSVHHLVKRALWKAERRDTFPTVYKMNTRRTLLRLFCNAGFEEETFQYLDDCRSLQRWRLTNIAELCAWATLRRVGVGYPERCILASYRKGHHGSSC